MKTFTNILMALTKGDSPLLWRGARGEAKSVNIFRVNIPNDNTKNINTLTIEIVGFDVKPFKHSQKNRPNPIITAVNSFVIRH